MSLKARVTNKPTSDANNLYRPVSFSRDIPTPGLFAWYAILTVNELSMSGINSRIWADLTPSLAFDKIYLDALLLRFAGIASYISPASPVPSILTKSSSYKSTISLLTSSTIWRLFCSR